MRPRLMEGRAKTAGQPSPGRPFWWSLASSAGLHASLFACALILAWGAEGTGEPAGARSWIVFAPTSVTEPPAKPAIEPERRIEASEPDPTPLVPLVDPPEDTRLADVDVVSPVHVLEPRHLPAGASLEPIARIRAPQPPPMAEPVPADPAVAVLPAAETKPRLLSGAPPAYPRESVGRGEEGTVLLRLSISARGGVASVEIVESSGHLRLDRAARDALLAWRFEPATLASEPIASTLLHPVTFRLAARGERPSAR
ncbi:MAG TPA: TonB family protein [Planctomycetota bacterium]|nr:TonB family protein [Planctomycetota bacterium]